MCHCWVFMTKLPRWRNTANVFFFFFLIGFLHNFTNKMNVGVWALTFRSEKKACVLFVSWCLYFNFAKKGCVFGTLLCFKSEQNSIRIPSFFFFSILFFFLYDVSSMSIALDNQLRQKEKKKTCRGPLNSLVSPQSIYIVGCFIWVIRYVNLLHIIWYD